MNLSNARQILNEMNSSSCETWPALERAAVTAREGSSALGGTVLIWGAAVWDSRRGATTRLPFYNFQIKSHTEKEERNQQ